MNLKQLLAQNRDNVVKISAGALVAQGFLCAKMLLDANKLQKQAEYLLSIVGRNLEDLEEFDIIALRELGVIKDVVE